MVEWKKLGEVCEVQRGKRITKGDLIENGLYPVISGGVTPMGYIDSFNREPNTITVSQYGTAGYVDFQLSRFWANDICYCVYPNKDLNNKYLWYVLKNKQNLLYEIRNTDAVPYSLPIDKLNSVSIPIPSLSEQNRIVGILDTFTASIDNLKEQIAQRRKQYEYYRDELLDLEGKEGAEIAPLRRIVKSYCTGATPNKGHLEYYESGTIPWLRTQDVKFNEIYEIDSFVTEEAVAKTGVKWIPANCVIVAISGATAGRCAINKIPTTTNQHCLNLEINPKKALYKYVYYCVYNAYSDMISKKQGARGDLNSSIILGITIPVPSLSEQQRIVSILDTFEASIQNLEAQLSQREKQYEFYRNILLSFE